VFKVASCKSSELYFSYFYFYSSSQRHFSSNSLSAVFLTFKEVTKTTGHAVSPFKTRDSDLNFP